MEEGSVRRKTNECLGEPAKPAGVVNEGFVTVELGS
jgi:hypothetical protein